MKTPSGPLEDAVISSPRNIASRRSLLTVVVLLLLLLPGCSIPRWPVEGSVASPFGLRMRGFWPDVHRGVDIAAPAGTEVRAMRGGTVTVAGTMGGYGRVVYIDHGRGLTTIYAHLSEYTVQRGERVQHRQVIGRVGSTGNATGPHLHFEVLRNGRALDPVPLLGGAP